MIRKMTASDRDAYLSMAADFYSSDAVMHPAPKGCFEAVFAEVMRSGDYLSGYILEYEGQTAGFALIARTFSTEAGGVVLWLEELYMKPEFRSKGLGREFFSFAEALPCARLRLEAALCNERAISLYKRLGFEELPYMQLYKEKKSAL